MKRLLLILVIGFSASSAFAQCAFQDNSKHIDRKDQYSKSSQQCIKNSESAMSKQESQFNKPKYAAELKPSPEVKKMRKAQF